MKSFLILILFALCASITISAQDIVQTEGIKTELHKNNIGRIFFTTKPASLSKVKQTDFLKTYTLTNKSDLFFVAFLQNSLTNYIHQLSPNLSADSLVKIGDFQYTLWVDQKMIYKSNLLPGAPYPKILDTATAYYRPLINNKSDDGTWSEYFWSRFMNHGGDSALTDGRHLLKMEIRPYIMSDGLKEGEIIAAGELVVNVLRNQKPDLSKITLNTPKPYDGFTVSNEKFDRAKIKELKGRIGQGNFRKISGLVVIKNGKLLIEEYFNGENRQTLHDPRSVGKSFSSTLTGMATRDGYIKSEGQLLQDFYDLHAFANYTGRKDSTSLAELLTMSSSFDGNDEDDGSPGNEENMYPTSDWVKFALDLPISQTIPAGQWHYFTAGVVILGDILNKQVKGGLQAYADEKLFHPLGITKYQWQYTPKNVPNTAGGIRMNALDFAKYGQLYKNGGSWKHRQILPAEWVEKTFTKQKQIPGRDNEYYGYLFWNKTYHVNGKSYEAFYCAGNGGNYILVFKDLPLVIVITATAYGQPYAHPQVTKMLDSYILPALNE